MEAIGLTEHETQLRDEFMCLTEYRVANWATQNLAIVIHRRGEWANRSAQDHRCRAIVLLSIRLLRAIRAGMVVHAIGWDMEGRAMGRFVVELRVRLIQVSKDTMGQTGQYMQRSFNPAKQDGRGHQGVSSRLAEHADRSARQARALRDQPVRS